MRSSSNAALLAWRLVLAFARAGVVYVYEHVTRDTCT